MKKLSESILVSLSKYRNIKNLFVFKSYLSLGQYLLSWIEILITICEGT